MKVPYIDLAINVSTLIVVLTVAYNAGRFVTKADERLSVVEANQTDAEIDRDKMAGNLAVQQTSIAVLIAQLANIGKDVDNINTILQQTAGGP